MGISSDWIDGPMRFALSPSTARADFRGEAAGSRSRRWFPQRPEWRHPMPGACDETWTDARKNRRVTPEKPPRDPGKDAGQRAAAPNVEARQWVASTACNQCSRPTLAM